MKNLIIGFVFFSLFTTEAMADFIVTKDASSSVSDVVTGNQVINLGVFRLAADNTEDVDIDDMRFTTANGSSVDVLYLYRGTTLLGALPGGNTAQFVLSDGTLNVPRNANVKVTVKAKLPAVDGITITNGTPITTGLVASDAIHATGLFSGFQMTSGDQSATANTMVLYAAKPVFAANYGSNLWGTLIPSSSQLLAKFSVVCQGNDDIDFVHDNGNNLIVNISQIKQHPDGLPMIFRLKDYAGSTLDTVSVADNATSVTFDFSESSFVVPVGTTYPLYIYGDTSDFTNPGDAIQLWLDDNNTNNIGWGINGFGNYHEADKLFRGDIYAGAFVTVPEPTTISLLAMGVLFLLRRKKK